MGAALLAIVLAASSARAQDEDGDGSPDEIPGSLVTIESSEGGLAGADLAPTIARAHRALRPCARARGRILEGIYRDEVRAIVTVAPSGAVRAIALEELAPEDPAEDAGPLTRGMRAWRACVERALRPVRFPRAASASTLRARVLHESMSGRAPEDGMWRQPSLRWTTIEVSEGAAREIARRHLHRALATEVGQAYRDALARDRALAGTITVAISVEVGGRVAHADARTDVRGLRAIARLLERSISAEPMTSLAPGAATVSAVLTLAPPPAHRP